MSDLRTLFPDTRYNLTLTQLNPLGVLYVYKTNVNDVNNGGQCCLWVVPTGATWAKFEVWGGGGGGGGACCCQHAQQGGGAGTYARKTIRVVPGQSYTICAAGSTCCYSQCQAPQGFNSYACNPSATYPLCLCARGGSGGFTQCFVMANGCYNCLTCICGQACGHDFALCGPTGASHNTTCGFDSFDLTPEPTYIGGGLRISQDHCRNTCGHFMSGGPSFPGGGGGSANSHDGSCQCSGHGMGGLVVITYK
jgi:hypothetical protein